MPKNDYAVGELVEFSYRCAGNPGAANPTATVLDEAGAVHETLTVGSGIELVHGRTFKVAFTPDAIGTWIVNVVDDNGGDAAKSFEVSSHSLSWVVTQLQDIQTSITALGAIVQDIAETDSGGGAHIG